MNYEEINDIFFKRFPHLEPLNDFDYHLSGPHILYGMVLNPYVKNLLINNSETEVISEVFSFYEEMALCDDSDVVNLLQVTLLEYLWDDKSVFDAAKNYMLPATVKVNERIRDYLREPAE